MQPPPAPQWGIKAATYKGAANAVRLLRHEERVRFGMSIGRRAYLHGVANVARDENLSRGKVVYWRAKYLHGAAFHGGQWGGYRAGTLKFGDHEGDAAVQCVVYMATVQYPNAGLPELTARIRHDTGLPVTMTYTELNIERWAVYADIISRTPWHRLKFLDEAHFFANDPRRTPPGGRELNVIGNTPRRALYSMTLLTSVEHVHAPLLYSLDKGATNCWRFFDFVIDAIEAGYIAFGDLLVVDDSSAHVADAMLPLLIEALDLVGARLVRLPAYSPEFNPCNQVFSLVKRDFQMRYRPDATVLARIDDAMSRVSFNDVVQFYKSCTSVALQLLDEGY